MEDPKEIRQSNNHVDGLTRVAGAGAILLAVLLVSALVHSAEQVSGDVSMTLTPYNPPIIIPDEGGNFAFNIEVGNVEATSLAFDVWTVYTALDGGGEVAGYGPVGLLLPGVWSAQDDPSQVITGGMADGLYTYTAYAGIYPDEIWDSDSFEFEKLPGSAGWYAQSPGAEHALSGVSFVDTNNGWAVSNYQEILHTTDGGDIWQQQDDGQYYPHQYNDVHFVDTQTGWVVGHGWSLGGTILHTSDAGATWIEQDHEYEYELNSVYFANADHGWAVGGFVDIHGSNHRQVIEYTSDGGETWVGQYWQSSRYPFQSVHFVDANHGWAAGGPGGIVYTVNGGATWTEQVAGTSSYLQDIFFVDADMGWCVGDGGTLLRTTDGGSNWQSQSPGTFAEFRSVFFVDAFTGWIAGVDNNLLRPVILHTTDGGLSWQSQDTGTGNDYVVLQDISFVDANHGWIAGFFFHDTAVMLHTENGGGPGPVAGVEEPGQQAAVPESARVSAPFPNPSNPQTRIRYAVQGATSQPVTIAIFDLRGQRIKTLFEGIQGPGEYFVDWQGKTDSGGPANSGVYLYSATIGDFATSGKLTMLK